MFSKVCVLGILIGILIHNIFEIIHNIFKLIHNIF